MTERQNIPAETCRDLLKRYWGYDSFRPLQEEVIHSVLEGRDTLALMPTGGGKSLAYQIPALVMEGMCIVVTPLIALMRDQVTDLRQRGIAAEALYTGMEWETLETITNKCLYHRVRFLYVSPERLSSPRFRGYLSRMPVTLIAVDEAHCISQWGYDFRPSYLRVAEIREFFPTAPVLALTATATPEVVKDIQERLHFREPRALSTSFRRANLSYVVRETENKLPETRDILAKIGGSAIVYVRRRETAEAVADYLNHSGLCADFYHAGLSLPRREQRQVAWKSGKLPIIVATNAFGMGIDKSNVRAVVHYDIPDSPEAYFQEAGRAGRDGQRAYAVLLSGATASYTLKRRAAQAFPKKEYIRRVYDALSDHFCVAEGGGNGMAFEFHMDTFLHYFKLNRYLTLSSIEILSLCGYLERATGLHSRPRVTFTVRRDQLYDIELGTPLLDRLLELLMRRYPGIFVQDAYINEEELANDLDVNPPGLHEALLVLSRRRVIRYIPGDDYPCIVYQMPRLPSSYLSFPPAVYATRREALARRIDAMLDYIKNDTTCRQLILMKYFGQTEREPCGTCDNCIDGKKRRRTDAPFFEEGEAATDIPLAPLP
ncbi:MAG: RecQ family ATP-dependent DNA helicase [Odoribacteraceae bacterium]|jgi:ATP-dependent DNA helicase RecQ|nr:RecQ family ATP-dependent DNA helicase [Odoribacteraceae bacterium]